MPEKATQLRFINIPEQNIFKVRNSFNQAREDYRLSLREALVPREIIDPRILLFEQSLHSLNSDRLKTYGLEYEAPEIFYVDRDAVMQNTESINMNLNAIDTRYKIDGSDIYSTQGDFILIYVNNFDDKDVDASQTVKILRHEMSHAGSARNFTAYPAGEHNWDVFRTGFGGFFTRGPRFSDKKSNLGIAFDEGHRSIEDAIFQGKEEEFRQKDEFVSPIPSVDKIFPGAEERYVSYKNWLILISGGQFKRENDLLYYKPQSDNTILSRTGITYDSYMQLMKKIYGGSQELYRLGSDFIYGRKKLPFVRRVNDLYGRNLFTELMNVTSQESAKELTQKISS